MNLSGFIKKVSFTAWHLDELYLAFAIPINRHFNLPKKNSYWAGLITVKQKQFWGILVNWREPSPLIIYTLYVMWQFQIWIICLMLLGLKRGQLCLKIQGNHCPETIYALFSENCWNKILIILLIGLITSWCFWEWACTPVPKR